MVTAARSAGAARGGEAPHHQAPSRIRAQSPAYGGAGAPEELDQGVELGAEERRDYGSEGHRAWGPPRRGESAEDEPIVGSRPAVGRNLVEVNKMASEVLTPEITPALAEYGTATYESRQEEYQEATGRR